MVAAAAAAAATAMTAVTAGLVQSELTIGHLL